ncbi:Glycosyltransferase family 4 protein [Candidatus Trichorickettsia mobilis]|uniref:Glycosyltransferase family 4 protein n=1 Tax=Candidatus Trichorickettsia mobilis TaxID=1346319 RepID=A0ABZ0UVB4_9RICK|nr:glycosyltransferase family 4 protein [Candidatus Trichorickettsia mobilis]WPY00908.1 Glycosyltransferase family 4 protein [Candidatus Trichorickettsia mobilis]
MTSHIVQLSALFLLALAGSCIITKLLIKQLWLFGIVDKPDNRRVHQVTTPRGGGLAMVLVLIVLGSTFEYFFFNQMTGIFKLLPLFLIIALVSFLDDIRAISVLTRFIIHLVCSALAVLLFLYPATLLHQEVPVFIDFIFATIALTAFLNIYNFLDGIDGITAVESIHLSITILLLCYLKYEIILNVKLIIVIAVILLACSISFLIFNWSPAQIFIGDVGSIGLGFLIGICLLLISASSARLFAAASIASLYYLADGGLTILIRLINRERIWQPHLKHFFQQAIRNGFTNKQVVWRIIFCNLLLMIFAISALYYPALSIMCAILVVMTTLVSFSSKK